MSSDVDICNLALAHLGDDAEVTAIEPPDGTIQAAHCSRFYPIALAALLEMHPWTFATKRIALAEVNNPSPDDWAYAYALPTTCLRPLTALLPGAPPRFLSQETDAESFPYIVEAGQNGEPVMYTNVETAVLRYIDQVTDTTKFTPLFVTALARLLAGYLAGPILKGDTGMKVSQAHLKIFLEVEFPKAAAKNANVGKRNTRETRMPSWLAVRGGLPTIPDARVLGE